MYCITDAFKEFISGGEGVSKVMSDVNYIEEDLEIFPGVWIPKERKTINTPKVTKEINLVINLEGKGLVIIDRKNPGLSWIRYGSRTVLDWKLVAPLDFLKHFLYK